MCECLKVSQVFPFKTPLKSRVPYFDLLNSNFIPGRSLVSVLKSAHRSASPHVSRPHVSTTVTHSPLSQFFPPNPSGQSQLKEPHRLTQVPPFRHGLLLQKCLFAEHPGMSRGEEGGEAHLIASSGFPHYFIKAENSWSVISRSWQALLSFPLLCSFYFCFFPLPVFHLNWLFERTDII